MRACRRKKASQTKRLSAFQILAAVETQGSVEDFAAIEGQHQIASIAVTEGERSRGALDPGKLEVATAEFARNGYLAT